MEVRDLSPSNYEEIKGSLIRQAMDKGEPDPTEYEIAKVVAGISFKAGERQGYDKGVEDRLREVDALTARLKTEKQAGMQEVRKWIDKAFKIYFPNTHEDPCIRHKAVMALTGAWQAFLKERELDK